MAWIYFIILPILSGVITHFTRPYITGVLVKFNYPKHEIEGRSILELFEMKRREYTIVQYWTGFFAASFCWWLVLWRSVVSNPEEEKVLKLIKELKEEGLLTILWRPWD